MPAETPTKGREPAAAPRAAADVAAKKLDVRRQLALVETTVGRGG